MYKIQKLIIKSSNGRTLFNEEFDQRRPNIIIAPSTFGKTIIMNLIIASFGNKKAFESLFGQNGIAENVTTIIDFSINSHFFKLQVNFDVDEKERYYEVYFNGHKSTFESSNDLSDYIFKIIKYPRWVTWDGNGKPTMLEDVLAPFYIDQSWPHGLGASSELSWKPANRIATSLAFHSRDSTIRNELQKFFLDDAIIGKMNNWSRISADKYKTISFLKQAVKNFNDDSQSLFIEKITLEKRMIEIKKVFEKHYSNDKVKPLIERNILIFKKVITNQLLSNNISTETIADIFSVLQTSWIATYSGNFDEIQNNVLAKELKEIRKKLVDIENSIKKYSRDFFITSEYFDHLKASILSDNDFISKEEKTKFEQLKENWGDFYATIKNLYRSQVQKEYPLTNFSAGFGFDYSSSGTNLNGFIFYVFKILSEMCYEPFILMDSIFQNDSNPNQSNEIERRILLLDRSNIRFGIITMAHYSDEVTNVIANSQNYKTIVFKKNNLFEE